VDTVFHLGAQTIVSTAQRSPLPTFEANIRGTYHVLEACRLHRALVQRIVVASSDKAYGEADALPYTEEMPLLGRHPYEVSKSCSDLLTQAYCHSYGLPAAIARCGNLYGGGDLNWSRIVPGTIRSYLLGEQPIVRSNGTYVRDYLYVKDAVRAYLRLAECIASDAVRGRGFNFSCEQPLTVLDIVQEISKLIDGATAPPIILDCAEGEIHSQYLCAAKARQHLGWEPEFCLQAGLRETIAWYRSFFAGAFAAHV
jgi:CDP-glucose 4,6-dehydratase